MKPLKRKAFQTIITLMISLTLAIPASANAITNDAGEVKITDVADLGLKKLEVTETTQLEVPTPDFLPEEITKNIVTQQMCSIKSISDVNLIANASNFGLMASTNSIDIGATSATLSGAGDYRAYEIVVPAGCLLQTQLTVPNLSSIDYNLYILNTSFQILSKAEYKTYLDGSVVLDETTSILNTSSAATTYYIYVESAQGGGQSFTLYYSLSTEFDVYEQYKEDSARYALGVSLGFGGISLSTRNISSPVDNDWYRVDVPDDRKYTKLKPTVSSGSPNNCSIEVYQDISNGNYQMKKVNLDSKGEFIPSTGTYYIKVGFNGTDFYPTLISNYNMTMKCVYTANDVDSMYLLSYNSERGFNSYEHLGGPYHYYAEGFLEIYGYATVTDPDTGEQYIVEDETMDIDAVYRNPAWDNYNSDNSREESDNTTYIGDGLFVIYIDLPPAYGINEFHGSVGVSYYDVGTIQVRLNENPIRIIWEDIIYHKSRFIS